MNVKSTSHCVIFTLLFPYTAWEGPTLNLKDAQTYQSSDFRSTSRAIRPASFAIDGHHSGNSHFCSLTKGTETAPWWGVDLGKQQTFEKVTIGTRSSSGQ